jgi:hypothetical protein
MAVDVSLVCAELEAIACIFAAFENPDTAVKLLGDKACFEQGDLVYRTSLFKCKLKLVMHPSEQGILDRVERLKKTARKQSRAFGGNKARKRSLNRVRYSKAVAQSFLDDGEIENHKTYVESYT